MPVVNRTYEHVEGRWLREYLAIVRPGARIEFEKKLTLPDAAARARARGPVSPRFGARIIAKLDAFIDAGDHVELWEAKQYPQFAAVSQLLQYNDSWPRSSEGLLHVGKPVLLYLLASHENGHVRESAERNGITYIAYEPSWLRQHQIDAQARGMARRAEFLKAKDAAAAKSG